MRVLLPAISGISLSLACAGTVFAESALKPSVGTFNDPPMRIDARGNIFIRQPNTILPPLKRLFVKYQNQPGLTIGAHSGIGGYLIENAQGDGVVFDGDGSNCKNFQIFNASQNGYVIKANGTTHVLGVISGARAAAIVITGDNNTVSDVVIADNCAVPFIVNGSNNLINYAIAPISQNVVVDDAGSHMRRVQRID